MARRELRWSLRPILMCALGLVMIVALSPTAGSVQQPEQVESHHHNGSR